MTFINFIISHPWAIVALIVLGMAFKWTCEAAAKMKHQNTIVGFPVEGSSTSHEEPKRTGAWKHIALIALALIILGLLAYILYYLRGQYPSPVSSSAF